MRMRRIAIGPQRSLGPGEPTLIVAEVGQNHNGSLSTAEQLVDAAAWAGADAVKFVKRDLECELASEAWTQPYHSPHAYGVTYGEHRRALELSPADHAALAQRARRHGVLYFATACDVPSLDLLEEMGVGLIKIASRDLNNSPLLANAASRGKPIFLSTGMSGLAEIDRAVGVLRKARARYALLQCTSLYPTPYEEAHLRSMKTLGQRYGVPVGLSDHTPGTLLPPVAVAMGAAVIEKHLTLDRQQKGTDHACSVEPHELAELVRNVRRVEAALGRPDKPVPADVALVRAKLGRSLVARSPLTAGDIVEERHLTLKCPGDGLSWEDRQRVLGRQVCRDVQANHKLTLADLA